METKEILCPWCGCKMFLLDYMVTWNNGTDGFCYECPNCGSKSPFGCVDYNTRAKLLGYRDTSNFTSSDFTKILGLVSGDRYSPVTQAAREAAYIAAINTKKYV